MRLIDADKVKSKLQQHRDLFVDAWGGFQEMSLADNSRVDEIDNCIAEIVNAPTIEVAPVVHGRWKDRFNGKIGTSTPVYECSVCGKPALYKHCFELDLRCTMHQVRYLSPYCPNCGAKMDGGVSDG